MPWEVVVWAFDQKFWAVPTPDQPDVLEVKFSDYGFDSDGQVKARVCEAGGVQQSWSAQATALHRSPSFIAVQSSS